MAAVGDARQAFKDLGKQKLADFKAKRAALAKTAAATPPLPPPQFQHDAEEVSVNHAASCAPAVVLEPSVEHACAASYQNGVHKAEDVSSVPHTMQPPQPQPAAPFPEYSVEPGAPPAASKVPPVTSHREPTHDHQQQHAALQLASNAAYDQVAKLQLELSSLSAAHHEAETAREQLQHQVQDLQTAHNQVLLDLDQAREQAAEELLRGRLESEQRSVKAGEEAARLLQDLEARVAELQSEADGARHLQAETAVELGKWREMVADLSSKLEGKNAEMAEAMRLAQEQTREWEDKYTQLHERHSVARSEFVKLKQLSSERKQSISGLQQEKLELQVQLDQARTREVALEQAAAAKNEAAEQPGAIQELSGELDAARRQVSELQHQMESAAAAAASEAAEALAELQQQLEAAQAGMAESRQQLEAVQAEAAAAVQERDESVSRLEDAAEQRDALKEAVHNMQEDFERYHTSAQESKAQLQRLQAAADRVPELEAQLASLSASLEAALQSAAACRGEAEQRLAQQAEALHRAAREERQGAVAFAEALLAEQVAGLMRLHEAEMAEQAARLEEMAARLQQLEGSEQKLTELQAKLVRAKTQFDKLKVTSADHKEKATALKAEVAALKELNEQLQEQLAKDSSPPAQEQEEQVLEGQVSRSGLEQELAEARLAYSLASGQLEALTQQHEALTQQHGELTQQHEALTQQHEALTQQHEVLTHQQCKLREDLTVEAACRVQQLQELLQVAQARAEALHVEKVAMWEEKEVLRGEKEALVEEREGKEQQALRLGQQVQQSCLEVEDLQRQLVGIQASHRLELDLAREEACEKLQDVKRKLAAEREEAGEKLLETERKRGAERQEADAKLASLDAALAERSLAGNELVGRLVLLEEQLEAAKQEAAAWEQKASGQEQQLARAADLEDQLEAARREAAAWEQKASGQEQQLAGVAELEDQLEAARREAAAWEQKAAELEQLQVSQGLSADREQELYRELRAARAATEELVGAAESRAAEAKARAAEAEAQVGAAEVRVAVLKEKLGLAKQKYLKLQTTSHERKEELMALQAQLLQQEQDAAAVVETTAMETVVAAEQLLQPEDALPVHQDAAEASAVVRPQAAALEAEVAALRDQLETLTQQREQALLAEAVQQQQQEALVRMALQVELAEAQGRVLELEMQLAAAAVAAAAAAMAAADERGGEGGWEGAADGAGDAAFADSRRGESLDRDLELLQEENAALKARLLELESRLAAEPSLGPQGQQATLQQQERQGPDQDAFNAVSNIDWGDSASGWEDQELMLPFPAEGQQQQQAERQPSEGGGAEPHQLIKGQPAEGRAAQQQLRGQQLLPGEADRVVPWGEGSTGGAAESGSDAQQLRELLEEAQLQAEELGRQVEDLEEARAAGATVAAEANRQAAALAEQLEVARSCVARLEEQRACVGERAESLEAALLEASAAAGQTEEALAEARARAVSAEAEVGALKRVVEEAEEALAQLRAGRSSGESHAVAVAGVRERVSVEREPALGGASVEAATAAAGFEELRLALCAAEARAGEAEERLRVYAAEAEAQAAAEAELRIQVADSEAMLADAVSRAGGAEARVAELATEVEEAEGRVGDLQERLAALMARGGDVEEVSEQAQLELADLRDQLREAVEVLGSERESVLRERQGREALSGELERVSALWQAEQAAWERERAAAGPPEAEELRLRAESAEGDLAAMMEVVSGLEDDMAALRETALLDESAPGREALADELARLREERDGLVRAAEAAGAEAAAARETGQKLAVMSEELEALQRRAHEADERAHRLGEAHALEVGTIVSDSQQKVLELEARNVDAQQQLQQARSEREGALQELAQARVQMQSMQAEVEAQEHELAQKRALVQQLQAEVEAQVHELAQARALVQQLQAEVQASRLELDEQELGRSSASVGLEARCGQLEAALVDAQAAADDALGKAAVWQDRVAAVEAMIEQIDSQRMLGATERARTDQELQQARSEATSAVTASDGARQACLYLEHEVSGLNEQLAAAQRIAEELRLHQQQSVHQQVQEAVRVHTEEAGALRLEVQEAHRAVDASRQQCGQWQAEEGLWQAEREKLMQEAAAAQLSQKSNDGPTREVLDLRRQVLELQGEKALQSSRAASAAACPSELETLRQQVAHLGAALKAEQRRAAEYYAQLADAMAVRGMKPGSSHGPSPAGSPGMLGSRVTGKKQDDGGLPGAPGGGGYDPESAVLQGASTTFQPLAGLLRGRGSALAVLAVPAGLLDKLTVMLYRRPAARVLLLVYFVLLHTMALVF